MSQRQGVEATAPPVEQLTLTTPDGFALPAQWRGPPRPRRAAVVLPAMATRAGFYEPFADVLVARGWGVLLFDYRGVGRRGLADGADGDTWSQLDLPTAFAEARRRCPRVAVVAHSIGGQLFGQSPIATDTAAALLVGVQRGQPEHFDGVWRLRLHVAWRLLPFWVKRQGHLPASRFTLPVHVPPPALLQWVRWAASGTYSDREGRPTESRFARYRGPLVAVGLEDDQPFAPPRAVEALTRSFTSARITRVRLRPQELGLKRVGHFGVFKIPTAQQRLADLLEQAWPT